MSASAARALEVIAFQLVAALDRYADDVDALLVAWPAAVLYGKVSADIDDIQRHAAALPALAAPSVALLIAHAELIAALWHRQGRPLRLADCVQRNLDCVDSLRRLAMRTIPGRHR